MQPVRAILAARIAGVLLVSMMVPNVIWLLCHFAMTQGRDSSAAPAAIMTLGEAFLVEAWRHAGTQTVAWLVLLVLGLGLLLAPPTRVLALVRRLEKL